MKKIVFALLLSITLVMCILPLGTSAAETYDIRSDVSVSDTTTEENSADFSQFFPTDTIFDTEINENTATSSDGNVNVAWSDSIMGVVERYTSEIFCILTFIGSLITAFCYKKGLLPTLAEGINKIYSIVVKSGEKASNMQAESAELLDAFVDKAMPILEQTKEISSYAEQLRDESLAMKSELERDKAQRKILSQILSGQIDLLYGVFMSASLPEYQKEQLGAQYNRLKSMISEGESNASEN